MSLNAKINFLGGVLGNAIEWFDFVLYVYFAPIFSVIFFPTKSKFISLILAFSVFASGYLIRPIGGFVLGLWGDKSGRKTILIFTISAASITTFSIAFLPTYQQIGITAPIILTMIRLLQGFAVSGELNCSASFIIEHHAKKHRGFVGSLITCTALSGVLMGSGSTVAVTHMFSTTNLYLFGWRIPFAVAGLVSIFGLLLRLKIKESPKFIAARNPDNKILTNLLTKYSVLVILTVLITCVAAVGDYFFIGYFTTFLTHITGINLKTATLINFICLILLIVIVAPFGWLSDIVGKKILFSASAICLILFSYPAIYLLTLGSVTYAFLGEFIFIVILAPVAGLIPPILAELFPTQIRNSGTSIGYNLGMAIFGGTAPVIALTLVKISQNKMAPAWYLIFCSFISLIAIILSHFVATKNRRNNL